MIEKEYLVIGVTILLQSSAFAFWLGKISTRVKNNEDDVSGIGKGNRRIGEKIEEFRKSGFTHFVTKSDCEAKQDKWKIFVDSMIDRRNLVNKQNADEHKLLVSNLGKMDKKLDTMSECLHKIQNGKECD